MIEIRSGRSAAALILPLILFGVNQAAEPSRNFELTVEIPRLNVSEYHRPYVAIWIQDAENQVAQNVSVWYQLKGAGKDAGTKWLPDLRQWWRRSGRNLDLPVDGVSGATRPVGKHLVTLGDGKRLTQLKPGEYTLVVEAAREVGGRELVKIPFVWPVREKKTFERRGKNELGEVTLVIRP